MSLVLAEPVARVPRTAAERQHVASLIRERDKRADLVSPDFGQWLKYKRPEFRWDYRHMLFMQEQFDDITAGVIDKLALQVSGRHAKTEHMTSYAVYLLEREPTASIIFGTYNLIPQASKIGGDIKAMGYRVGLPIMGSKPSNLFWKVEGGGSLQCIGVDSGTASLNPDYILIDDPIGKRADAESFAHREKVWLWLTTDILARVVPGVKVVFSMPRWHVDDPMGRLLDRQSDIWTILDMPGRALKDDQLGRAEGELLWPDLRGEDFHQAQRATGGAYGYASFIQCRPTPREGGMYKWDWWGLISGVPAAGSMVRYWDTAGTDVRGDGHDPDYTAGVLGCRMVDLRTAIVDVERFQKSPARRDARMVEVAQQDLLKYQGRVTWWIEPEAGVAGKDRTDAIVRKIQNTGMAIRVDKPPTGKKIDRGDPLASAAEAGNVVLCPGEWRDSFRAEMADFPGGDHDDQYDGAVGMFAKLSVPVAAISFGSVSL